MREEGEGPEENSDSHGHASISSHHCIYKYSMFVHTTRILTVKDFIVQYICIDNLLENIHTRQQY